ncbi:hypothetical protein [Fulvivirga sedimenti]|uniref:DUF2953 domain-containing protein n=1 Tax=Fulvivirga sedimenti TaxID=2879465 RepID=A0A9X1HTU6_9BACT|nr:hypothetical protein [Fulvivirga sedimenti]MCA6075530.1 hypothetical protein [Fulvivirga sedimenti]MCA6076707.1 hypothetical protein [Fulvivirga sedimenti]MCA6077835.1 hypothetical protein [Fulvivirga sedimenti]
MLIVITILLLIILGILFVPIVIQIDTVHETYLVKVSGIGAFQMDHEESELVFILMLPFYKKVIHPFRLSEKRKKSPKPAKDTPGKKEKKKSRMTFPRMLSLIRSFRIREFYCTIDSGDYVRNAMLVPVFQAITSYRNNLSVNFTGEFQLQLYASNNLFRLGRAYLNV